MGNLARQYCDFDFEGKEADIYVVTANENDIINFYTNYATKLGNSIQKLPKTINITRFNMICFYDSFTYHPRSTTVLLVLNPNDKDDNKIIKKHFLMIQPNQRIIILLRGYTYYI